MPKGRKKKKGGGSRVGKRKKNDIARIFGSSEGGTKRKRKPKGKSEKRPRSKKEKILNTLSAKDTPSTRIKN